MRAVRAELISAERRLCRGAQGPMIAALSRYVAAQFQEHYATDPARIVLTLNGVKIDPRVDASAVSRLRGQILDGLGVTESDKPVLFLFAAHNFRLKGLDRLIEALRIVRETRTERPAHVVVVGTGACHSQRLAQRLGATSISSSRYHQERPSSCSAMSDSADVGDASSRHPGSRPTNLSSRRTNGRDGPFHRWPARQVVDAPDASPLVEAIRHFTTTANLHEAARHPPDDPPAFD
jgi:hypothetical protein